MRPSIGWPIAIILALMSVGAFVNGEALNEWVEEHEGEGKKSPGEYGGVE